MSQGPLGRKPRYDGRTKKRQWEERRSDKGAGLDPKLPKLLKPNENVETGIDRIKRRKYCILMGYSGSDYYGMQRNPNTRTIEEDFFKALFDTNFINKECYDQVQNMHFQRAARTDKGVSAARQIVSLKLGENFDFTKVNEILPKEIRLFACKRVTKGFNSKVQCDGRTYIYITPTVAFANQSDTVSQEEYRLPEDTFQKVNNILGMYVGTKNYHNFTSKKKYNDPSSKRFIRSFICERPFVRNDIEFCVLKVNGQSFMLHQIRKMVGLLLAIIRGIAPEEIVNKAFDKEKVNIPRAPGLGLVLDYVHYERYNNRYGSDGMHEKLTWEEVDKDVEEFKEQYIYPTIINTEKETQAMVNWIYTKLCRHSYDEFENENDSEDEGGDDDKADEDENKTETKEDSENISDTTSDTILASKI
ncbi:hypothetical protein GWI33_002660 [Rhynchophorus ferrugineus]|uniref:Pseudouridylate synthase 1 homolog n=1 Tax=Rhynchophorus ferrugineus TaxID=354439 RepID=A0A834IQW6_RHYFE|nr:hypothetical protein GWI33_002660 [Rhynchophorus ferrugineus]